MYIDQKKLIMLDFESKNNTFNFNENFYNINILLELAENITKCPMDFLELYLININNKESSEILLKNQTHIDTYLNKEKKFITIRIKEINMITEKSNDTGYVIEENLKLELKKDESTFSIKDLFLEYKSITDYNCEFCNTNLLNKEGFFCLICFHLRICKKCIKIEDHTHPMLIIKFDSSFNGNEIWENFYNNNSEKLKKIEKEYYDFISKQVEEISFFDYLKYIDKLKLD